MRILILLLVGIAIFLNACSHNEMQADRAESGGQYCKKCTISDPDFLSDLEKRLSLQLRGGEDLEGLRYRLNYISNDLGDIQFSKWLSGASYRKKAAVAMFADFDQAMFPKTNKLLEEVLLIGNPGFGYYNRGDGGELNYRSKLYEIVGKRLAEN